LVPNPPRRFRSGGTKVSSFPFFFSFPPAAGVLFFFSLAGAGWVFLLSFSSIFFQKEEFLACRKNGFFPSKVFFFSYRKGRTKLRGSRDSLSFPGKIRPLPFLVLRGNFFLWEGKKDLLLLLF